MQKYSKLIMIFILLAGMALVVYQAAGVIWASAVVYHSPLAGRFPLPGEAAPAQSERVVLVIMSGLGRDAQKMLTMPTLERLQESGASATIRSQPPSYRQSTWVTLISGANPSLNDAPPFDVFENEERVTTINTIFHNAQQKLMGTVLVGSQTWQKVILPALLTRSVFTPFEDERGDQQIMNNMANVIEDEAIQLILLQFNQIDYAAQTFGGIKGEKYRSAAQQVDIHLNQLVNMLDLDRTTLIITSDYGHIEEGGHGGGDLAVIEQPFIMVGKNVVPGNYSPVEQVDVAPTIAVLLGLSLPAANQGRPLLEMLQISNRDKAEILLILVKQRFALVEAYLRAVGLSSPEGLDANDISRAEEFFEHQNHAGTVQLAQLIVDQTDETMQQAKAYQLDREQRPRLWASIGFLAVFLLFIIRQRSELWTEALFCGIVIVAVYHLLYRLNGYPYSFSAIGSMHQTWTEVIQRMLLSILSGGLSFVGFLALRQYKKPMTVLQGSYEMVLFAITGFIGPVLYGFWQIGSAVTWVFPDISTLFYYLTGLMQTFGATVIGIFVPFMITPLNAVVQKAIDFYQHKQTSRLKAKS